MGKHVHKLSSVDAERKVATCANCGPETPVRFRNSTQKWVCRNQDSRKSHGDKWKEHRRTRIEDQNGKCAICGEEKRLVLDHDHDTGKKRGALCFACNTAIGLLKDDPGTIRRAAEYVEAGGVALKIREEEEMRVVASFRVCVAPSGHLKLSKE